MRILKVIKLINKRIPKGRGAINNPFNNSSQRVHLTKAEELLCDRILQDLRTIGIQDETIVKAIHYCHSQDSKTLLPISCDIELNQGCSSLSAQLNIEINFQDGDLKVWTGRVFLYPVSAKYNDHKVPLTNEIKALGYQILINKPGNFIDSIPAVRIDSLCTSSFFDQGYRASAGMKEIGCDCYAQRRLAKTQIYHEGGLSMLTPFSGRGNGARVLSSEIQMQNFAARNTFHQIPDTYETHMLQGHPKDNRSRYFWIDGLILSSIFNLRNVKLLTNNPEKIKAIREYGISVTAQQHVDTENSQYYLGINAEAKKLIGNHTT